MVATWLQAYDLRIAGGQHQPASVLIETAPLFLLGTDYIADQIVVSWLTRNFGLQGL